VNPATPGPGRHRTPSADVHRALVDAAGRLLEDEGPAALTVRGIAAEAGVAPMGLYSRLGGIAGVIDELFREGFDALAAQFATISLTDPAAALIEAGLRYRRFAKAHPARYMVMFDRTVRDYVPTEQAKVHAAAAFGELVALVAAAMGTGGVESGDPAEVAQRLWSVCHGAVSLELRGLGFVPDVDAHYRALLDTVLRGLSGT